jgi:hypothetical protein
VSVCGRSKESTAVMPCDSFWVMIASVHHDVRCRTKSHGAMLTLISSVRNLHKTVEQCCANTCHVAHVTLGQAAAVLHCDSTLRATVVPHSLE